MSKQYYVNKSNITKTYTSLDFYNCVHFSSFEINYVIYNKYCAYYSKVHGGFASINLRR